VVCLALKVFMEKKKFVYASNVINLARLV